MNCIGIMFKKNKADGGGAIEGHFITGQGYQHPNITELGDEFLSVIDEMLIEHDFNQDNTRLYLFFNPTNTRIETNQALESLIERYHMFRSKREACGESGSKSGVKNTCLNIFEIKGESIEIKLLNSGDHLNE